MRNDRVAAVVVTYNRLPMLQKCIAKLEAQTEPCDILVVNNASSDGTTEWLAERETKNTRLHARDTGANLGGAGGFNFGMRWAVEAGYEYLWVMDDDCLPEPDALEVLTTTAAELRDQFGFLSSKVLWKDGSLCRMNVQRRTLTKNISDYSPQLIPVVMASFVSLFLRAETVRKLGLPIRDFFIWTDDWEFARRISRKYPCYAVSGSVVVHESKSNIGANIATESVDRLDRFDYLYRNDVYLYRREGMKGFCYEAARLTGHCIRVILKSRDSKAKRIKKILGGSIKGLKFNPAIEYVDCGVRQEKAKKALE